MTNLSLKEVAMQHQPQPREATTVSPPSPPAARAAIPRTAWRAARAGAVGTFVENYDYLLYGTLVVFFAPRFFPAHNQTASFLAGLAVLGAGYVARPLGAIIFGRVGDRRGRRAALIWTVALMGAGSGLVGILPTYAEIGVWAPILLTILRLGQGISAGAEQQGAVTYVLESAPPSRRAFLASFTPMGSVAGSFCGLALVGILSSTLGSAAMSSYGWRIPFLISIPLALVVVWMRSNLEDSPEFQKMAAGKEIVRSPLRATLQSHWKALLLAGAIAMAPAGTGGLQLWFSTYLVGTRKIPSSTVFTALAVGSLVGLIWVPLSGRLTDRFGRKRTLVGLLILFAVLALPVLWLLTTATSFIMIALVMAIYGSLTALLMPPAFSFVAELFPRQVRHTASAIGINIGAVLGTGLAPFVAAQLVLATGTGFGAAIWIGAVVVLCLAVLPFVAETGGKALRS